ncbi:MAG: phage terminase large subunit family protein [Thermoguttaceae bacterium]|nr:phage terminase large subunit family protein [Thermoguttaceae bacterium]
MPENNKSPPGELGDLPPPENPARRAEAAASLRVFCETYFPEAFYLAWSPDHLKAIGKIESAVRHGGLFALAMPRGSGKTVLCQTAVLWSALLGAAPFICLIASNAQRARSLLETIKIWIETNPLLGADFPEVCCPIRAAERVAARFKTQTYRGVPTRVLWSADRIVLPTIDGSAASGTVVGCSGMRGSDIRGLNHARPDGRVIRPSLVLIDDPQTTESAWSETQSRRREEILAGDILGMAGPAVKIAGLLACTVIRPGDMADAMLDRKRHPEWQGERTKLVYRFPDNEQLWAEYARLRADSLENDGDGAIATEFYRQHRAEMDAGAVVSWEARYNSDEISALQHAMNLRLRSEEAFFAEYQNEPIAAASSEEPLTVEKIAARTSGYARGVVPMSCPYITAFIDVHDKLLYYVLAAWENNFTGYVIDYGTWPRQNTPGFTLRGAARTLAEETPNAGFEGRLFAGLTALCEALLAKPLPREDGLEVYVDRCLIDANWGASTDIIYQFCARSPYSSKLTPSHGRFIGPSSIPFSMMRRGKGDRVGRHWRIPAPAGRRQTRHIVVDVNYWKSFLHARLSAALGDPGALTLFDTVPAGHRYFAEHLTAEYRISTERHGQICDQWRVKPGSPDNHWLDCLVGAAAAASMCGAELEPLRGAAGSGPVSFARMQSQRREGEKVRSPPARTERQGRLFL